MKDKASPPDDTFKIRCSKLGHQIQFSYCRKENFGIPCARSLTCWHPYFTVAEYLRAELTPEQWRDAFEVVPKQKLLSIVELIEEAQKRKKSGQ
jgi:hypothetical protein